MEMPRFATSRWFGWSLTQAWPARGRPEQGAQKNPFIPVRQHQHMGVLSPVCLPQFRVQGLGQPGFLQLLLSYAYIITIITAIIIIVTTLCRSFEVCDILLQASSKRLPEVQGISPQAPRGPKP